MIRQCYRMHINFGHVTRILLNRTFSTAMQAETSKDIILLGHKYPTDEWTNVTPRVISKLGRNLHILPYHPLSLIRQRIVNYFYLQFHNRIGNPIFSVYDNLSPIVTVEQNFDSLLVPKNHSSRNKTDCYYINGDTLLRAHMTAHQTELISMGLNNFLVVGDVYRRDEIDSTHYPVFHQVDAVRLCTKDEVFENVKNTDELKLFEHRGVESNEKQSCHTLESVKVMEYELKNTLTSLAQTLFGSGVQYRTGTQERIGWAFGLGLERLAMCLYDIPDIRLFWSKDSAFSDQFKTEDPNATIKYKPISIYPPCKNDISFWLPENKHYSSNDFYDLVREVGGDRIQQVVLKDEFTHPETKRLSHCYTITYRHMERTLSKLEVNNIHAQIRKQLPNNSRRMNLTY
ncbi:Probable phenylalanine--tRNA ligase, mitochondrial [Anthophora quadrimaculata]